MDAFDRIEILLRERKMSQADLSRATGISTGLISQWKKRMQQPSGKKLSTVADYFGVSIDYLLGKTDQKEKTPTPTDGRSVNDNDIKLALFGGDGEVTDEMWEEALFAAQLIKERYKRKKKDEK